MGLKLLKDDIIMLVWDLPMWLFDEFRYSLYNLYRKQAAKIGIYHDW